MTIPRPEYPRPQFFRSEWLNLNGEWQFEIDYGDSGLERGLLQQPFSRKIQVPFCPESKLSGIEHTDFMPAVWYRREVEIPPDWKLLPLTVTFSSGRLRCYCVGQWQGGWAAQGWFHSFHL